MREAFNIAMEIKKYEQQIDELKREEEAARVKGGALDDAITDCIGWSGFLYFLDGATKKKMVKNGWEKGFIFPDGYPSSDEEADAMELRVLSKYEIAEDAPAEDAVYLDAGVFVYCCKADGFEIWDSSYDCQILTEWHMENAKYACEYGEVGQYGLWIAGEFFASKDPSDFGLCRICVSEEELEELDDKIRHLDNFYNRVQPTPISISQT